MNLDELKTQIREAFSFVAGFCPNFPAGAKTTVAREFDELCDKLQILIDSSQDEDAKAWLRLSLQETRGSRKSYESGDRGNGVRLIRTAKEHFANGLSKKSREAKFIAGVSGPAQDSDAGFSA